MSCSPVVSLKARRLAKQDLKGFIARSVSLQTHILTIQREDQAAVKKAEKIVQSQKIRNYIRINKKKHIYSKIPNINICNLAFYWHISTATDQEQWPALGQEHLLLWSPDGSPSLCVPFNFCFK